MKRIPCKIEACTPRPFLVHTHATQSRLPSSAMEPFPDLTGLDIFPQPESNTMEFKETFTNLSNEKIHATLCGFLNSRGLSSVWGRG